MKNVFKYLEELESRIPNHTSHNSNISEATVGWQVGHALKVIRSVCKALKNSDPETYKKTFNLKRDLILAIGRFPRGKARAPKHTIPKEGITQQELYELLSKTRESLTGLEDLPYDAWFPHPVFGSLRLSHAHKFLELHTKHHLLIIKDILK